MNRKMGNILIVSSLLVMFGGAVSVQAYSMAEMDFLEEFLDIEYSSIEAYGGCYVLCRKDFSGFSESSKQYGIYDWQDKEWTMDYCEIPEGTGFSYAGEGMFFYTPDNKSANPFYLLNAEEGELYTIEGFTDGSLWGDAWEMRYQDGYAVDVHSYEGEGFDVFVFDKYGNYWSTGTRELFGNDWEKSILFWNDQYIAYIAGPEGEESIVVQTLDGEIACTIDDKAYVSRYTEQEDSDPSRGITVTEDYVILTNMTGVDWKNYCAAFDLDGNLVLEATLCDRGYVSERGNLILINGEDVEEILLQESPCEEELLTDIHPLYTSREAEQMDVAADQYGTLHTDTIAYGCIISFDENPLPYDLEESWYLGGEYQRLTGTVFVEPKRDDSMSCMLWIVGDDNNLLYQSDVINNVTKPFKIDVDVSGTNILHIGYSGTLVSVKDDQFMLSGMRLSPDAETDVAEDGFYSDDSWDEDDEIQDKEEAASEPKDTLLSFLHAYIGELGSYGVVTDNMGNTYTNNFLAFDLDYSATYDIGGNYKRLTGTIAVTKADVNEALFHDNYAMIRISGDGNILYENLLLGIDTKPFEIDVDVSGVVDLKIEMRGEDTNLNCYDGLYLIFADATLHVE